jgi:glutathione peroxidase
MKKLLFAMFAAVIFIGPAANVSAHCGACGVGDTKDHSHATIKETGEKMDMSFNTITGEKTDLSDYEGKVVLMVNVASKCGNVDQYAGLEELYRNYKDKGLVVLGFPANNFGNQEPGTNEEILNFCTTNYDVTFPMMAKISVKGDDIHPLYHHLTNHDEHGGEIKWNFTKYLLDRKGNTAARFEPGTQPTSDEIVKKIEELL